MDEVDRLLNYINWLEARGEYDRADNVRDILNSMSDE